MKNSLTPIRPDSFSGLLFGLEALRGGMVLLHGPTGCKFYHSAVVDGALLRSTSFDPLSYPEKFYFGQGRIPCTYLDSKDYIYGVEDKLRALLEDARDRKPDFIALVNSPGAALIGDDLNDLLRSVEDLPLSFAVPTPGYSKPFGQGVAMGQIALLEAMDLEKKARKKGRVNLLGADPLQNHVLGNLKELKRLLTLAGLEVGVCFYDESLEDLKKVPEADYNLVFCPETGLDLAKYLEDRFGTPYFIPSFGQPVAFKGTEEFFKDLKEILDIKIDLVLEEVNRARARAYIFLARYSSLLGLPKGGTYTLRGPASFLRPLKYFLSDYLGMAPLKISPEGEGYGLHLRGLDIYKEAEDSDPQLVFGDGNDVAAAVEGPSYCAGIEIQGPTLGYLDVVEKTFYGPKGGLYLLELVLNGLKFRN